MKKFIIISLITLSLSATGAKSLGAEGSTLGGYDYLFSSDDMPETTLIKKKKDKFVSDEEMAERQMDSLFNNEETVQSVIYNSVLTSDPRTMQMNNIPARSIMHNKQDLTVFQRSRIRLMNWIRTREEKSFLKDLEREKQQLEEFEKELDNEKLINDIFYTSKDKKLEAETKVEDVLIEDPEAPPVRKSEPVKLKGKLKQTKGENVVVLDAKNIYYVEEDDEIIAENSAVVKFPKQKITMKADRFVYSNSSNIIKALGNVKITRGGHDIFCDSVQVNVNEEEIFFEKIKADIPGTLVAAENGYSKDNTLYLFNGYLSSDGEQRIGLPSRKIKGFRPDNLMDLDPDDQFFIQPYVMKEDRAHFDTEKIIVKAKRDHDVVTLKNTMIRYGHNKAFRIPSLTAYMNKSHTSFEANYPEFGSIARLGMYIGPGFVFEIPRGGVVKFIPFLNYRSSKLGVGGALRYKSSTNTTELGYGSVSDIWVLKGHQKLDDKLSLEYGMNYFQDQWFLGPRMPKYALELLYRDRYLIPSTFKKGLNMTYEHHGTFGYYHNSMYNMYAENFKTGNIGTFRGRYMAQIKQELYKYKAKEDHKEFVLSALLQGSAALYGTGDTQFIGRAGVNAHTRYKNWQQDIGYFLSAWQDNTPLQRFDAYRYGTSMLQVREAIKLCKFLSVAWTGFISLSDDAPNGKLFQENAFLVMLGPEDVKFTLGYDFVRKRTYLTFGLSFNTTGTTLNYKTLEIKNPEKLANGDNEKLEELKPEFWLIPQEDSKKKVKKFTHAQVINLNDDDNRERID